MTEAIDLVTGPVADMVRQFHEFFDVPDRSHPDADVPERNLRLSLIDEEVGELAEALGWSENDEDEATLPVDTVAAADALADIVYVCYGAALTFGIDLDAVIREVHRANMSKLGADGRPIMREDGKVLKGPNYTPPNVAGVLAR